MISDFGSQSANAGITARGDPWFGIISFSDWRDEVLG
jgi:hypothetical protein